MPDLRELAKAKDRISTEVLRDFAAGLKPTFPGQYEELLTDSAEVRKQVNWNHDMTQTPLAEEPEVKATEGLTIPKLKLVEPKETQSHEESRSHVRRFFKTEQNITRRPNRWDSLGSFILNVSDGIQTAWQSKIGQDTVLIYNHNASVGTLYIASTQQKLQGNPNRGWPIAPGGTWSIETEAGAFMCAVGGAVTVDIAWTWFEDEEGKPY